MILAAAALAALCSCNKYYDGYFDGYYETTGDFLILKNYSDEPTVWLIPEKSCAEVLPEELSEWQRTSLYEVAARSSETLSFDSDDHYTTPPETYAMDDNMVIYVFKKSVWDSNTWKEIVRGKMWAQKYSLSVSDALSLDRAVSYPVH